jgi:2-polyprenyl-6-hydroxyphenyl methylase/3-demethylubiquinone-9 3-methyltransferase
MTDTPAGTVDPAEVGRFARVASRWWDPGGEFAPLHRLNPVRIAWLKDAVCARFGRDPLAPRPLEGLSLLDVGSGGGLLTEPMARLGARAVGIDADAEGIRAARARAAETGVGAEYRVSAAETVAAAGERFDVVLAMEVVEHVADVDAFCGALAGCLEPGGIVAFSTLNRTARSFALGIVGAEWVLRWVPRGTHDWRRFLRPSEVAAAMRRHGLAVGGLTGVVFDPLRDGFRLDPHDLAVNYMGWAARPGT